MIPRLGGTYCKTCGALVPAGSENCPKCGMPVSRKPAAHAKAAPAASDSEDSESSEDEFEKQDTRAIPRIESSIPSVEELRDKPYAGERPLRTKFFMFAAIAALILVGGITLYITHPWNPNANVTHATEDADTSQAGYPGAVSSLKGQDSSSSTSSADSSTSSSMYDTVSSAYEQLGTIRDKLVSNQSTFDSVCTSSTLADRVSGKNDADSIATSLSNLISSLQQLDQSTSYTSDIQNMVTLGNYLRNYSDALCESWSLDVAADDPSSTITSIKAPLTKQQGSSGTNSYVTLFDNNYSSMKPTEK